MCTSDSTNLVPSSSPQGSLVSWRRLSHEEIEASVQVSVSSPHILPPFPSVFSGLIRSCVLPKALQLTSGLRSGRGALLLVGQLNRQTEA